MKNRQVLVISAHPDDVDFGCGGTLAKWAREGAKITYCICTSGEKGTDDPTMTNLKLARTREKEQRAAAKVIGAEEVIYLRKPDGELQPSLEFRGRTSAGYPAMPPSYGFYPRPGQPPLRRSIYFPCRPSGGRRNGVRRGLPRRREPEFFPRPPGRRA